MPAPLVPGDAAWLPGCAVVAGPACWARPAGASPCGSRPPTSQRPAAAVVRQGSTARNRAPPPARARALRSSPADAPENEQPTPLAHALRASRPGAAATNGRRLPALAPQAGSARAAAAPGPRWPATPPDLLSTTHPATGRSRRTPRPAARGRSRRPWRWHGYAPAHRSRRRIWSSRRARSPR